MCLRFYATALAARCQQEETAVSFRMGDMAYQDGASAVSPERAQSEKTCTETRARRFRAEYLSESTRRSDRTDGNDIQDRQGHSTSNDTLRGSFRGDGRPRSNSLPSVMKAESSSQIRLGDPLVRHYSAIPQQVADRVANTGSTYDRDSNLSNPTTAPSPSIAKIESEEQLKMRLIMELKKELDYERARHDRELSNKEKELQQCKAQLEASKRENECLDTTKQSLQCPNDELRKDNNKLEDRLTEVESGLSRFHESQTMRESCDQEIRDQLSDIQQQLKSEIKVEQRLDGQDTATHHSSAPLAVPVQVSDVRLEREILMVCGGREVLVRYTYEIDC